MRSSLIALAAAVILTTGCSGTALEADAGSAPRPTAGSAGPVSRFSAYAALGDSYSAAPLNPESADEACLRSTANYPARLADALGVPLVDVTCAGAKTDDVAGGQQVPEARGGDTQEPQIEAVDDETDLVTIGLGGNDGGLFTVMTRRCLARSPSAEACLRRLKATGDASDFRRVRRSIVEVVRQVRQQAADDVTIVLVDYPRLLASADGCPPLRGVPQEALAAVANAQRSLNRSLAAAAEAAGALFLDLEQASSQHGLCAEEPWVNGRRTRPGVALRWHPLPVEQAGVATRLRSLLGQ